MDKSEVEFEKYVRRIFDDVVGKDALFAGPYGSRLITFANYTSTSRPLASIETHIQNDVLPYCGGVYSGNCCVTGAQAVSFRDEARGIIRNCLQATEDDAVILTGTGATDAINRFIGILKLHPLWNHGKSPVVFIGPFEHHSNILPWRESGAEVVEIPCTDDGNINMTILKNLLKKSANRFKIGSFSAGCHVNGRVIDTFALTVLLHSFGALACFDIAAALPHLNIDISHQSILSQQPSPPKTDCRMDAVFLSSHKLLGGVGAPGILVCRRFLINAVTHPVAPGGSAAFFVTKKDHRYIGNVEEREEAGNIDVSAVVRCGLVFRMKSKQNAALIQQREQQYLQRAFTVWSHYPNLVVLGGTEMEGSAGSQSQGRLPIVAFNIRCGNKILHYNFVAALLNDLFGIQCQAGHAFADPYTHQLLSLSYAKAKLLETEIIAGDESIRPGFVRVTFTYFMPSELVDYIIQAISFVAEHGWRFLSEYELSRESAEWKHKSHDNATNIKSINDFNIMNSHAESRSIAANGFHSNMITLRNYLDEAKRLLKEVIRKQSESQEKTNDNKSALKSSLCWYVEEGDTVERPSISLMHSKTTTLFGGRPSKTWRIVAATPSPKSVLGISDVGNPPSWYTDAALPFRYEYSCLFNIRYEKLHSEMAVNELLQFQVIGSLGKSSKLTMTQERMIIEETKPLGRLQEMMLECVHPGTVDGVKIHDGSKNMWFEAQIKASKGGQKVRLVSSTNVPSDIVLPVTEFKKICIGLRCSSDNELKEEIVNIGVWATTKNMWCLGVTFAAKEPHADVVLGVKKAVQQNSEDLDSLLRSRTVSPMQEQPLPPPPAVATLASLPSPAPPAASGSGGNLFKRAKSALYIQMAWKQHRARQQMQWLRTVRPAARVITAIVKRKVVLSRTSRGLVAVPRQGAFAKYASPQRKYAIRAAVLQLQSQSSDLVNAATDQGGDYSKSMAAILGGRDAFARVVKLAAAATQNASAN